MIIGLSESAAVGAIEYIDLFDGDEFHENVPVMIMRVATQEEWIVGRVERGDSVETAQRLLARRTAQFPQAEFYDVSVD